ncbi:MAG: hypothetical protein HZB23_03565 [Deltaproteobacteria bacterium]|nr:hypothetical protein [Deltaproteobacteria bacterium]
MANTSQMGAVYRKKLYPSAAAEIEAAAPSLRELYAYKAADDTAKAELELERQRIALEKQNAADELAANRESASNQETIGQLGLGVSGVLGAHQLGLTTPLIGAGKAVLAKIFPSLAAKWAATATAPVTAAVPAAAEALIAPTHAVAEPVIAAAAPSIASAVPATAFGMPASALGVLGTTGIAGALAYGAGNLLANPVQTGMDVVNDALFGNDDSPWDKAYRSDVLKEDWSTAQNGWAKARELGYEVPDAPDYNSVYSANRKTGTTNKGDYTFFDYDSLPTDFTSYIEEGKAIGKQLGLATNDVRDMFGMTGGRNGSPDWNKSTSYKPANAQATSFWDANPTAVEPKTYFNTVFGVSLPRTNYTDVDAQFSALVGKMNGNGDAAASNTSLLDQVRSAL